MLDLFGNTSNQRQPSGITGHQIAVNNVLAIRYEAGRAHYVGDELSASINPELVTDIVSASRLVTYRAHYVGDELRIDGCRELNNSIVSERLSHGPLHRPQSSWKRFHGRGVRTRPDRRPNAVD